MTHDAPHKRDATALQPVRIGWRSFGALMPGFLLSNLEASLLNVALPTLGQQWGLSLGTLSWVPMTCQLATVSLAMVMGALADRVGRKRVYAGGLIVLAMSAALGGLASSLPMLLLARALQGIGSAALIANGLAIVAEQFEDAVRGRALGIMTALVGVAAIFAPVLGAWLASAYDWRAIFWVQLPVALLGLVQVVRRLPPDRPRPPTTPFPMSSALVFAGAVGTLVLGLWGWGEGQDSPLPGGRLGISVLLVTSALLLWGWQRLERQTSMPLLPLEGIRAADVFALLALCSASMTLGALGFALPLFLSTQGGLEGLALGLQILPLPLGVVLGAVAGGHFKDRGPALHPMLGGLGLAGVGLLLHALGGSTGAGVGLLLAGTGLGAFSVANNAELVHGRSQGVGALTGLMGVLRQTGNLLGVALAGSLMAWVGDGPGLALGWYGLFPLPGLIALLVSLRKQPSSHST